MGHEEIEVGDFVKHPKGAGYVVDKREDVITIDAGSDGIYTVYDGSAELVAKQYRLEV